MSNSVVLGLVYIAGVYVIAHRWPQALHSILWTHANYNDVTLTPVPDTPGPKA